MWLKHVGARLGIAGDDVYYYNCWRLKLEGETESICVCTKERKGVSAEVLMATPCTNSLGDESGEQKHVRSAAALATMRPVLLLRVLKKAARR